MQNNLHRVVTHRDDLLVTHTTECAPEARTRSPLKINSVYTEFEVARMRHPHYQQQHDQQLSHCIHFNTIVQFQRASEPIVAPLVTTLLILSKHSHRVSR